MYFEIVGEITHIETIAAGRGVRGLGRLRKRYGTGRWRKLKGLATVRLVTGRMRQAEVHWYEAHGVGRKGFRSSGFWIKSYEATATTTEVCPLHTKRQVR